MICIQSAYTPEKTKTFNEWIDYVFNNLKKFNNN